METVIQFIIQDSQMNGKVKKQYLFEIQILKTLKMFSLPICINLMHPCLFLYSLWSLLNKRNKKKATQWPVTFERYCIKATPVPHNKATRRLFYRRWRMRGCCIVRTGSLCGTHWKIVSACISRPTLLQ